MLSCMSIYLIVPFILDLTLGCCPNGWVVHENHCYSFITSHKIWTAADSYCQLFGAHLANVETASENTFVTGYIAEFSTTAKLWLGGTDSTVEGEWMWIPSGTDIKYTDWGTTEPNEFYGPEDCLAIHYDSTVKRFRWVDASCTYARGFVCEKPMSTQAIVG